MEEIRVPKAFGELTPEQQSLLMLRMRKRAAGGTKPSSAPPLRQRRSVDAPLSFAQERLWFISQLESEHAAYNSRKVVRLTGLLNLHALERAVNEIVRRHEVLRTTIEVEGEQRRQVIATPTNVNIEISPEHREAEIKRAIVEEAARPFDLARGPLLRLRLFRIDAEDHVLLLTMHHIVTDAWSMSVFMRELSVLYNAYSAGGESPLPELPIQYADYAVWQREWLQGEVLESQLQYWRKQLSDCPPELELPTDHPRLIQGSRGERVQFSLSPQLTKRLKELSRQEDATLFMLLLAAWQLLLARYTGQSDVIVGSPIANRTRAELEGLIGFFVNTLALRVTVRSGESFRELLKRVREVCLEAYAHQDVPFEKLVEELKPERSLTHQPFFQVVFQLLNTPVNQLPLAGLEQNPFPVPGEKVKFDLELHLREKHEAITGLMVYRADLFEPDTIQRLLASYQTLLEDIVTHPERKVDSLALLTPTEARELSQTDAYTSRRQCIHEIFAAQVAATPDAVAVVSEHEQLTFRELNERANQLAHYLQKLGVGPESLVGICVERSVETVVGLLGILKAGAAYLPLDPQYPQQRLAFMLKDAVVEVLLTQQRLQHLLPESSARVFCLDSDSLNDEPRSNPPTRTTPASLAYVMYTSGSTGTPKGVLVEHRSVVRLVSETNYVSFTSDDVFLQYAPISFDASTFEIWGALLNGARLAIPSAEQHSLEQLGDTLQRFGVTTLWLTAGLFHVMVDRQLDALKGLRQLLAGGDALSAAHVERARLALPNCQIINGYGPTENTTFSCCHRVDHDEQFDRSVPIGRAVTGSYAHVLNDALQLVPANAVGELYVGGHGLARGYLARADVTAEKFIPDPFSREPGARLYRTGDLVRRKNNGVLEFLGRTDAQIKVRGFRVELGEIEAALLSYSSVKESVVVAQQDTSGENRVVAYVVATAETTPDELRHALQQRLPAYMIPAALMILDQLPLTANGKVDRRALPDPDLCIDSYIAPRTLTEEVLAQTWSDLLKVEKVGVNDNFFTLGGHSLLATVLISRVRQAFGVELPLRFLFESPTIAALAEQIDLSKQTATQPQILSASRQQSLPLSFAQERLWFINQLEPESTAYNIRRAVRLRGDLDHDALAESLSEIVRRHEVLRTSFNHEEQQVVQVIAAAEDVKLPLFDLGGWPENEREAEVRLLVNTEARRGFDLSHGPLFRALLIRLSQTDHVLILTMHHIVSDGWSMGVLIRELSAIYAAFVNGEPSPLADLAVQYADYSVWQREWLQGDVLAQQLAYWQQQLAGAPETLNLPTDRPRPSVQTFDGATVALALPSTLLESLKEVSRREDVTLFMTLLMAFQVLLHWYTGQDDILVGTPIANRNRHEVEPLIGFFTNTLVMRSRLSGEDSFKELLKRVRETCLQAYAHQDVPFEKLVEELAPRRSLSHSPVVQVMFGLQNAPQAELVLPGLTLEPQRVEGETPAKFDLTMLLMERHGGLSGVLRYNASLFEAATMQRLANHFQRLLECVVESPERKLASLSLITESEQQRLSAWNETFLDYPRGSVIHELFEQQVERCPESVAVTYDTEQLTFRELNEQANQLAHHLRSRGVANGSYVGLLMERSTKMVVALLGILKAGAAYVPLDPSFPTERLSTMLIDAGVELVLTQGSLADRLPQSGPDRLCLDEGWTGIERHSKENLACGVDPENVAYVIFTSGSSGRPKGVMVQHRSVINLATALEQAIYSNHKDVSRVGLSAPLVFDASVKQLVQLLCGRSLYVIPETLRRDARALLTYLERHQVQVVDCTPSQLRLLLDDAEHRLPAVMLVGGEAIDQRLWEQMVNKQGTAFYNVYGPTECTVDATVCRVQSESPTIGHPIANTEIQVLNRYLQQSQVGVYGELCIGGAGLSLGYINQPELTAERFVPHPFSSVPGARLYKTADCVRHLADGSLQFVGRFDRQIKVRGFRIELGEIESSLRLHPAVNKAAVVLNEENGEPRLIAYVVAREQLSNKELRAYLKDRLPEYMIPGVWVQLDDLPVTTNGKIDIRALPQPSHSGLEREDTSVPQTDIDELLCGIVGEVLKVEQVGMDDNFFDLGGHSLLAAQLVSRLRKTFGVELPLRMIFEEATIGGLSARIEEQRRAGQVSVAPPLQTVSRKNALPLSFAQERLWVLDQLEPANVAYNMPIAFRLNGPLKVSALERSLNTIINRHEVLRTRFTLVKGMPVQTIAPLQNISLSVTDHVPAEVRTLASEEACQPFDLADGPLLRASLLRLGSQEHVLLLTMHHIVSDGWSMGIFVRELSACYNAYAAELEPQLPELPIQYGDYAVWQRKWLQGEVLEDQLQYWREQLLGAPQVLELPTDRPRPTVQSHRGALKQFQLKPELTRKLKELSRSEDVTLFMLLLAAFQVLLARYSGQNDVVVGTPIANRTRAEVEALIGLFVNTLALRVEVRGGESFRELLKRVRQNCLGAYAHQDVPFEKLVEELQPERSLSYSPVFQVMFALQNAFEQAPNLTDLQLSSLGRSGDFAKFDLTLLIREHKSRLLGGIEYNSDLFDEATIDRMCSHLNVLLESIVADPASRVSELSCLESEERSQLIALANGTEVSGVPDVCIHQLFEAQVERNPCAMAVVCGEQRLTYAELNERANQLAHFLQPLVGPETLVGICMERSHEMVIALLAILKAGGSYLPLDPAYPPERLSFMMKDAEISLLLTESAVRASVALEYDGRFIELDTVQSFIAVEHTANPHCAATPDNQAYVIYTSGSTGRPKGAMLAHRGLGNLLTAQVREFDLVRCSRVLQFSSLSFDASIFEIVMALMTGSTLYLKDGEKLLPGPAMIEFLQQHGITHLTLPPSVLKLMPDGELPDLRVLIVAGEECSAELVHRWSQGRRFFNAYGPTEATVWSTLARCEDDGQKPSIGRPIINTSVYVLDEGLQPAPAGVAGELYIGGIGLARGYLKRPELTAERFVPHPFSVQPDARLYKTGDLGRYRSDGQIEYLGRTDDQVKVRGFRIELGEIEAVLRQHSAIRECAVVPAGSESSGQTRLVAYLICTSKLNVTELRAELRTKLPEFMIPAAFVVLDRLPLTANGKLDRRALPKAEESQRQLEHLFVAPRTPLETVLAGIWAELLDLERVGINDNFFESGGNSLLATQVVASVQDNLMTKISVRWIFEEPTVAGLAATMLSVTEERTRLEKTAELIIELSQFSDAEVDLALTESVALVADGTAL